VTESTANDKVLKIGRFELVFPADHKLDVYQQTYKLYDQILGQVGRACMMQAARPAVSGHENEVPERRV